MPGKKFSAQCPSCHAELVVDAEAGAVTLKGKGAAVVDLGVAVQSLKEDVGRRENLFKKSLSEEKTKTDRLKQKFDEALKQAKETPDAERPLRDIDLD